MSRPSHLSLLDAARALTHADGLFAADWRAISCAPGCHVGFGPAGRTVVLADGPTREAVLAELERPLALFPIVDLTARNCAAARAAARRQPSYAHPEAPAVEAHDCPGCDDIAEGRADLCDACRARYAACDAVEYPELNAIDAAWFDVVTDALADLRRARRAA